MIDAGAWLLVHLVATTALAAVGWLVQLVVYPSFALVGPGEWERFHARHQRAIAVVVGPPWLAQGIAVAVLTLALGAPGAVLAALALAGVALTVLGAVPEHRRLTAGGDLRRLLRANLLRTLAWTAAAAYTLVLVALPSAS
jgi:hypothetical protein